MTDKTTNARTAIGKVVSDKMDKTIVVLVVRKVKHPKYKKIIKRSSKIHAHDEKQTCKIGNTVKIRETRPHSKLKCWEVIQVFS